VKRALKSLALMYFYLMTVPLRITNPKFLTRAYEFFLGSLEQSVRRLGPGAYEVFLGSLEQSVRRLGFTGRFQFVPSGHSEFSSISPYPRNTGILIQGPLATSTAVEQVSNTINLYAKLFPTSQIVLSTWENSLFLPHQIADLPNFTEVRSKDPGPSWPTNLQRQIVSTSRGLGAFSPDDDFVVIKTRTDQRITSPRAVVLIQEMVRNDANCSRLWALDYGTGRFRIYGITDQFQFAQLSIMKKYWSDSTVLDKSQALRATVPGLGTELRYLSPAVHEILLNVSFLNSLGHRVDWSWEDHEDCLEKYFGILDSSTVGLDLLARIRTTYDHVLPGMSYSEALVESHLTHADWLLIKNGYKFLPPTKETLKRAMKVPDSDLKFVDEFWEKYK